MKVVIDADDAATGLKKVLVEHLLNLGVEVTDLDYAGMKPGAFYPEIGLKLLAASREESSIQKKSQRCSLTPQQAAGNRACELGKANALTGFKLALRIKSGEFDRGILICGTSLGMAMIADKVESVYAGVCHDVYSAERLRMSNDAQVLTMGARMIGPELAKTVVDAWLKAEYSGGEPSPKVHRMHELEKQSFHPDKS